MEGRQRNPLIAVHGQSQLNQPSFKKSKHISSKLEVGSLSKEENSLNDEVGALDIGGEVKDEKQNNEAKALLNNDVESILSELSSSVEEPELEDEQLRMNDQLQEDELLAMESIYGENVFILDRQRGLRCFQIHIQIEAPEELTITSKLNSSNHLQSETESENSDDFKYSFKVQYLPPIILTCLLSKSYPSHLPPFFTISVQWLNSARVSDLSSMLDSMWSCQPAQEIIYQWTDWLHNSSLSYLGLEKEIILGPFGVTHIGDRRAVSGSVSPNVDISLIRSYNDERCLENFIKSFHECCICFSDYAGTEFVRLPCKHFFCWKCMKTFSDINISEGTISKLQCPDANCRGNVPPSLLKRLLGDGGYKLWESLMLQKTLESMPDVAYCPRCETPCIEDEEQHAQCSKCFYSFCTHCREKRHVGETCRTPESKLRILQERQNSSQINNGQKQRERQMINEILSVNEIFRDAMQCPSCKMAISRTYGCNIMVCKNCGQCFCYRCNKAIDLYKRCRCGIMAPQKKTNHDRLLNAREFIAHIQAEFFLEQYGLSCPNCDEFNPKVGTNNHIFCWACQVHYCYLCRGIVRDSSQHYGPEGCEEHTVG